MDHFADKSAVGLENPYPTLQDCEQQRIEVAREFLRRELRASSGGVGKGELLIG